MIRFLGFLVFVTVAKSLRNNDTCISNRSFVIDYQHDRFLKDGARYQFISGALHYFRIPEQYWEDRIVKAKAAGLNAIETYIPWNFHEPHPGQFDFEGRADVVEFIKLAAKHGLDFILRMGPYTCGELDNGGHPWWLVQLVPDIKMRTHDARYLYYVSKWYFKLFPLIVPLLYKNGGPIIMLQVENEYGSYFNTCDTEYMAFLRDMLRSYVGNDVVLFTVDGGTMKHLRCGYTPGIYPTVDFGPDDSISEGFLSQRVFAPHGPLVNMEYYPGWLDIWGLNHSLVNTSVVLEGMTAMYEAGASFNFYVFHGGTNFGYSAGSVGRRACTTSYDYDAPLDESGDPTPKYIAIRNHIETLTGVKNSLPIPKPNRKRAYGNIETILLGSIFDLLYFWAPKNVSAKYPLTFEELDFPFGFVLYETIIPRNVSGTRGNLTVVGIRDRGYVMVDGEVRGIVSNMDKEYDLLLTAQAGSKLQILVENNGRPTKGNSAHKGIISNASLDGRNLTSWIMYPIVMETILRLVKYETPRVLQTLKSPQALASTKTNASSAFVPSFYYAKFSLKGQSLEDTFLNTDEWGKGHIFINDFNLGRYWPSLGPQVTLYVPKVILKPKTNYALIFELIEPGNCVGAGRTRCSLSFTDRPILDKMVPGTVEREPF